jgi:hypothetical protein
MKIQKMVGLAGALALCGAGFAASTVGATAGPTLYNSTVPLTAPGYAQAFNGTEIYQFGNAVTLAAPGLHLGHAVVEMANFYMPDSATVAQAYSTPLTFTIYKDVKGAAGATIARSRETVAIPAGVSGVTDGVAVFDATFNFTGHVALPSKVIYGIEIDALNSDCVATPAYCGNNPNAYGSLNVVLSTEPTNVTVGSDVYPGYVYVNTTSVNTAGPSGEVSCSALLTGFTRYSTAAGAACGYGAAFNIPAVELIAK